MSISRRKVALIIIKLMSYVKISVQIKQTFFNQYVFSVLALSDILMDLHSSDLYAHREKVHICKDTVYPGIFLHIYSNIKQVELLS